MKFSDFKKRDDLCRKGQSRVLNCPNVGSIVKVGRSWYATRNIDTELLGVQPNSTLIQPTVGPFSSAYDAFEAFSQCDT